MFDNLVENKYEINSLIIVLFVLGQYLRVLLFKQPVFKYVVVYLLNVATCPDFLVFVSLSLAFYILIPLLHLPRLEVV